MTNCVRIGMLGFGTVGTGAYRMLFENKAAIASKIGLPLEVVKIGIRDSSKPRGAEASLFTTDLESIVDDPEIDVILELIGGIVPAEHLVERALNNGKHVITANKELIAKRGAHLTKLAQSQNLDLHFEAAVGGGIPLIQPLKHQLAGNDVLKMMGVLNGTSNYILTQMEEEETDFAEALRQAQAAGYAEADPTNDVAGIDTAYKIAILSSIAVGKQIPIEQVTYEGIESVSIDDIIFAKVWGYKIKLLGVMESLPDSKVRVRVHPALIDLNHPLSAANGVNNALWLRGDFVGDVTFTGRGAGSDPTASAVIGDLIDVARDIKTGTLGTPFPYDEGIVNESLDDLESGYYIRMEVTDKPKTLGEIAMAFGHCDIGIAEMEMRTLPRDRGEIVFLTHPAKESAFRRALEQIKGLHVVHTFYNAIRIVS